MSAEDIVPVQRLWTAVLGRNRAFEAVLLLGQGLNFLTSVLIARSVGTAGRGTIVAFTTWGQILGWMAVLSLDKAVIVFARNGLLSSAAALHEARRLVFSLSLIVGLGALALGGILFDGYGVLSLLLGLTVIVVSHYELWMGYTLARGRMSDYLGVRLLQSLFYSLAGAAVYIARQHLSTARGTELLALAFLASMVVPVCLFSAGRVPPAPRIASARKALLNFGARTQVSALFQVANMRLDLLVLPLRIPFDELGIYAVALAPAQLLILTGSAGLVRGITGRSPARDVRALLVVVGAAAAWFFLCPMVLPAVFGTEFARSVEISRILVVGAVPGFASQALSGHSLGRMLTREVAIAHGTATLVFAVGLFSSQSLQGVAWSSVASYVTSLVILERFSRRPTTAVVPEPPTLDVGR